MNVSDFMIRIREMLENYVCELSYEEIKEIKERHKKANNQDNKSGKAEKLNNEK